MNLTVGPLPPAVYWRRRALVALGLIAMILLVVYSCGGSGTSDANGSHTTAVTEGESPSPSPSPSDSLPSFGSAGPTATPSAPASTSTAGSGTTGTGGVPVCSDRDMQVTASIESTSATISRLQYGGTFAVKLKIKNVSDHACTRDVGTVPEELKIVHGSTKIWSSDDCDGANGARKHDVRTFQPNIMIMASLTWNSYLNTAKSCTKGKSATPVGTYQLYGRLGTLVSDPTTFKIEN